jgi:hypothetical protein
MRDAVNLRERKRFDILIKRTRIVVLGKCIRKGKGGGGREFRGKNLLLYISTGAKTYNTKGETEIGIYVKGVKIGKSTKKNCVSYHPPYAKKAKGQGKHVTIKYASVKPRGSAGCTGLVCKIQ